MSGTLGKVALTTLAFVLALIAYSSAGRLGRSAAKSLTSRAPQTAEAKAAVIANAFAQVARKLNAAGPQMVDSLTRFDSASAGPGARLTYFNSFTKAKAADVDVALLRARAAAIVLPSACRSMSTVLRQGAVVVYSYSGEDRVHIAYITVRQSDCDSGANTRQWSQ